MSLKIVRSPSALADLEVIADFITEKADKRTAHKVLTAIEQACERLSDFPGMGAVRNFGREFTDLRVHPVSRYRNYLVFYQATDEFLIIRRVLHGAQNVEAIFKLDRFSGD